MALVRQITVQLDSGILCSHLKWKDIHNKMLSEKKVYSIKKKNLGQCKKVKNKFLKFAFKTESKLFLTYLLVICTPFYKMLVHIFYPFSPLGYFSF